MCLHTLLSHNSQMLAAQKQKEAYREGTSMGKGPEAGQSLHLHRLRKG